MKERHDSEQLTDDDRERLGQIEAIVADPTGVVVSDDPIVQLSAALTQAVPLPEAAFTRQLRQRLLAEHARLVATETRGEAITKRKSAMAGRLRLTAMGIVAAFALLILSVGVVIGQGRLAQVLPSVNPGPLSFVVPAQSDDRSYPTNVASESELQARVPFPLLVPTHPLAACPTPIQRAYDAQTQVAHLVYRCVSITEHKGDHLIQPADDSGTVEDVVVNGQPALYFRTTYVVHPNGTTLQYTLSSVMFERDGLLVWITTSPMDGREGVSLPSKDDLIHLAESMRPLSAPGTP